MDIFDIEEVRKLREMLLIGLASYGEIDRLVNEMQIREMTGQEMPSGLRPIHPTGCPDTVCDFADALRSLARLESMCGAEKRAA